MEEYLVSKCFETVTEESAENGGCADHGFIFENVPMSLDEIKQEIMRGGYSEPSSSYIPDNHEICREWIGTVVPEQTSNYFEKGEAVFYSLHINGMHNKEFIKLCKDMKITV